MILEIYLFLFGLAFIMMGLSFYTRLAQKEMIMIPFLTCGLFAFVAISSFSIQVSTCQTTTYSVNETVDVYTNSSYQVFNNTWSCNTTSRTDAPLGYFAGGMAVMMMMAAIYWSVNAAGEYAVTGRAPE